MRTYSLSALFMGCCLVAACSSDTQVVPKPHLPIQIESNNDLIQLAHQEGWPGQGTQDDPIIIQGLIIDLQQASGNAIGISNTDLHLTIRQCELRNGKKDWLADDQGFGIMAQNVANLRIEHSIATEMFEGIRLLSCNAVVIHHNKLNNNSGHGIALEASHNNLIEYNQCLNEGDDGILIGSFDPSTNFGASDNNIFRYNEFAGNSTSGVCLFRGSSNLFYGNVFEQGNRVAVLNTASENKWDDEETQTGNWWYGFSGPDEDQDGRFDVEKPVGFRESDRYPLVEKPSLEP